MIGNSADLVALPLDVQKGDLQEHLLELAQHHPVARAAWAGGEVWLVNEPELAQLAFRDARLSKEPAAAPPWFQDATGMIGSRETSRAPLLVASEGPEHARQRKLHMMVFAPHHRQRWDELITGVARECLRDCAAPGGEVDLVPRFAYPLPIAVICAVFGLPADMHDVVDAACRLITYGPEDADREHGRSQLYARVGDFLGPRRGELREGMIADLLALHEADGSVSINEIATWMPGLVIPGHESTASVLSSLLWEILKLPPDQRPSTVAEIETQVEWALRRHPPFPLATWRFSTSEVLMGDHLIPAEVPVLLNIPAFNQQPERLSAPTAHYTFGHGAHYCIGAPLARAELRIALTEFLRTFPKAELAPRAINQPQWVSGFAIRQLTSLPVQLNAL